MSRLRFICWAVLVMLAPFPAVAQLSGGVVRIGVLTDMDGVYSDANGRGSLIAAEMAVEEFGKTLGGRPIEIVSANHQNKPDIAATKARQWFETGGVDVIVDLVTSSVALAVQEVGRQMNRPVLISGAASSRLTNEDCSPVGLHWTYDTYALAVGTAKAVVEEGGDS